MSLSLATLRVAIRNLLLHKLRSFLTMLGTILGVASVVSMLAIGEGSKREAVEQIRRLGATNVIVRSVERRVTGGDTGTNAQADTGRIVSYGLTYRDLDLLRAALPTVHRVVPATLVRKEARRHNRRLPSARILGTTPEHLLVKLLDVRRGRFLSHADLSTAANVVVLGAGAAETLFSFEDPIDKTVHLGPDVYRVIGVLAAQSSSATPGAVGLENLNDDVFIPITASRSRLGEQELVVRGNDREVERRELSEITLTVADEDLVSQTAMMVRQLLGPAHRAGDDFEVQVPLELLAQAEREKRIWNIVLGSIASISLLVGGIGIMNIMLATVTERTREIGIRRALGAKRRDITLQFLVETTVLSATGGVLGVLVGVAVPLAVTRAVGIDTALSWWSVVLAFGISVFSGIAFGLYPAQRAARMDPIEALRHE